MSLNIGNCFLPHGLMLAPMAGVTDSVFRALCKKYGAEYTVSEMVCAKALCYEQRSKKINVGVGATAFLAKVSEEQLPMGVQIFGSEPEYMAEAARMIADMSYKGCLSSVAPTAIDINMGCPVRKITSNGEGSALMRTPELAEKIVRAVCDAVALPITVKIRAGWDKNSVNAPELAKRLEQSGVAAICVHARTREQLYSPGIDLSVIERTKKAVSIPVIGNGDVYTAEDAVNMINKTGCDGVMVGRGAQGAPWLFSEISARLDNREYVTPTTDERLRIALAQLDSMIEEKGERTGLAEAKKHMAWYVAGIKGAANARARIMTAQTANDIRIIFNRLSEATESLDD